MNSRPICAGLGSFMVAVTSACGSTNPVAPAPVPRPTATPSPMDRYVLYASAGVESSPADNRIAPGCSGAVTDWVFIGPSVGVNIGLGVNIILHPDDSGGWIGRTPSTEEGDIELRLQQVPGAPGEVYVRGTLRGAGSESHRSGTQQRVSFDGSAGDGAAIVEGHIPPNMPLMLPNIPLMTATGNINFTDGKAHEVTCSKAALTLANGQFSSR